MQITINGFKPPNSPIKDEVIIYVVLSLILYFLIFPGLESHSFLINIISLLGFFVIILIFLNISLFDRQ